MVLHEGIGRDCRGLVVLAVLALGWPLMCLDVPGQEARDASVKEGLPRWEAGVGGFGARLPLYRGSDEYKLYAFPIPYVIYRGDIIQVEREGVRGFFHKGPLIETDFSMSGNPPVRDGDGARKGMPELDPLLEAGPAVRLFLYRGSRVSSVYLEAAVRGVVSFDLDTLSPGYEGTRGGIGLVLASYTVRPRSPWRMGFRVDLDWSDAEYNGYFYDVDKPYVLPDRPPYDADGGYGGWSVSGWLTRKLTDDLSLSVYGKMMNCEGAAYEDSPLVKTRNNFVVGSAMIWKLAESKTRVRMR